jgi:hypothetical protein
MYATAPRSLSCVTIIAIATLCLATAEEVVAVESDGSQTEVTTELFHVPLPDIPIVVIDSPGVVDTPGVMDTPTITIEPITIVDIPIIIISGPAIVSQPTVVAQLGLIIWPVFAEPITSSDSVTFEHSPVIPLGEIDWTSSLIGTHIRSNEVVTVVLTYSVGEEILGQVVSSEPQLNHFVRFSNLTPQTIYTIEVIVYDALGNAAEPVEIEVTTEIDVVSVRDVNPVEFALRQNAPNPFNPSTTIRFDVTRSTPVNLAIYSTTGQIVRTLVDGAMTAGTHQITWDGADNAGRSVAGGVYIYRLQTSDRIASKRMTLIR